MDWDNQDVFSEEISLCEDFIDHYKNLTDYYSTSKETLIEKIEIALQKYLTEKEFWSS